MLVTLTFSFSTFKPLYFFTFAFGAVIIVNSISTPLSSIFLIIVPVIYATYINKNIDDTYRDIKLLTLNIESEFTKECVIIHGISDLLL